jgi:hypothetical protein
MFIFSNMIMMTEIILQIIFFLTNVQAQHLEVQLQDNTEGMRKLHPITNHKRKQKEKR